MSLVVRLDKSLATESFDICCAILEELSRVEMTSFFKACHSTAAIAARL